MAILNLAIGKSKYSIECPVEEQEKILNLAHKLNERVNKLSLNIRNADEKTILMLCALMIQDESESKFVKDESSSHENSDLVEEIDNLTNRIYKLTNTISTL
ncbi:MAG: cell division protein ZapA (FtsZ GTPase activity inhibitor) [Lentimonas sp.]|jgi:cell division protein ZapA (FtsZ GTPase activity inhibitor)